MMRSRSLRSHSALLIGYVVFGAMPIYGAAEMNRHWTADQLACVRALAIKVAPLNPRQINSNLRTSFDQMVFGLVRSIGVGQAIQGITADPVHRAVYVARAEARVPNLEPVSKTYRSAMETMASNVESGNLKYAMMPREELPKFEAGQVMTGDLLLQMQPRQIAANPIFSRVHRALWTEPLPEADLFDPLQRTLELIVTPVGEYGADFARDLLRTTRVMMQIAVRDLRETSATIYRSDPELFSGHTARGVRPPHPELAPLSTTIEGILSLHQIFASLLAVKLSGAPTGSDALRDLIFASASRMGLVSEFTARLPMGLIGPMALSGHYFARPLERDEDGHVALTDAVKRALDILKTKDPHGADRAGVCPMAPLGTGQACADAGFNEDRGSNAPRSSLQILAEAYWTLYQRIRSQ